MLHFDYYVVSLPVYIYFRNLIQAVNILNVVNQ